MKVDDIVRVKYMGRLRYVRIIKRALKRSRRTGQLWWWCEVEPQDKFDLTQYHWRFLRQDTVLASYSILWKGNKDEPEFRLDI